jgi:hypothetical protein
LVFAPASLILTNYFLPLNEALCVRASMRVIIYFLLALSLSSTYDGFDYLITGISSSDVVEHGYSLGYGLSGIITSIAVFITGIGYLIKKKSFKNVFIICTLAYSFFIVYALS